MFGQKRKYYFDYEKSEQHEKEVLAMSNLFEESHSEWLQKFLFGLGMIFVIVAIALLAVSIITTFVPLLILNIVMDDPKLFSFLS